MRRPKTAGERQTVRRVMHPQRGECWAVYDNGPSFVQPIGGEPLPMPVGLGGCSAGPPSRTWTVAYDPEHGRVEMDHLDREDREPTHQRVWHSRFGAGWLVARSHKEPTRFEPDEGTPFEFLWVVLAAGRPEYAAKSARTSRVVPHSPEEMQWFTYTTEGGEVFAFRRNGPPGPDVDDTVPKPKRKHNAEADGGAR